MSDPASYRPAPGDIPTSPGVYRFRDERGQVVYVGKARNLRSRLTSYFADPVSLHPRTRSMVFAAASVDWVMVATEVEALSLEYSWIKEHDPRFNVKYRDDKSYPYLAITMSDAYPRAAVVREAKRKGTRYFGPYAHAWAIRDTLDILVRVFPVRTCRDGVFQRAKQVGRPCLLAYIDKCSAPCVGRIEPEDYRHVVDDLCAFLGGSGDAFIRRFEREMLAASSRLDYEEAARLRDRLGALTRALERNAVVFDDSTDADVIGVAEDELQMGVQVFHVRGGRIRGERGFVVEKAEELDTSGYVERVLQRLYGDEAVGLPPREVLVSSPLVDAGPWNAWLSALRGSKVAVRTPQRGDKRTLMATAVANAGETLRAHTARRSSDLTTRSQALRELQDYLALPEPPLRIECIDISTLQGQDTVASLVVFEDGMPRKRDYRSFVIRTPGADDTAAMGEVVGRRFREREESDQASAEPSRFAYPPALLVVDGGAPQVRAAQDALMAAGVSDLPVVGLAKRLEEVWLPDEADPVILPRTSEALYLLQRVRDEAHRTAIALHRKRRGKRATSSALDDIPGLGPARAKALLKHFGSVRRLSAATPEELCVVPGIGPSLAAAVAASLGGQGAGTGAGLPG
ncbi:MAG: excinuclease ABC subunit UvrC [Actinomycetota bacterium]|nr:excinuclease ABC subunit UvrC [Actinomycetota bacterium]